MTAARIARLRTMLAELNVDALVLTNPANRMWATGFTSYATTGFSTDIAIVTATEVIIMASGNNTGWAKGESLVATDVVAHSGPFAQSLATEL